MALLTLFNSTINIDLKLSDLNVLHIFHKEYKLIKKGEVFIKLLII